MTFVSHEQQGLKTYTFYCYDIEASVELKTKPNPKRVVIQETALQSQAVDLFKRQVVYVSPKQKAQLPDAFMRTPGIKIFLGASSLLVPKEYLPQDIDEEDKQEHRFDSAEALKRMTGLLERNLDFIKLFLFEWYKKGAAQGFASAQHNLGVCYLNGLGVEQDFKKAVFWFKKGAAQNDSEAQNKLGDCYRSGLGVKQNFAQALLLYQKAAEKGVSEAQCTLGVFYSEGEHIKKDLVQAFSLYQKAADKGLAVAQHNVAFCYQHGYGVAKDINNALFWYEKAGIQGLVAAQYTLAEYYQTASHIPDYQKITVYWCEKAADQNYPLALNRLAYCYQNGFGLPKDLEKAVALFQKAVDQKDVCALYNLACCYQNGLGLPKDLVKAFTLYQQAADQKFPDAQYSLGYCYQYGYGVPKDLDKAAFWYEKAAIGGFLDAVNALKIVRAEKESLSIKQKKKNQVNLQSLYKVKFDGFMKSIHDHMGHYETLKTQWLAVMGKDLQIKCFNRIQELEADVNKNVSITPKLLKEIEELFKNFSQALQEAERSLEKARAKADRKAHQEARRASQKFEVAPVIVEPFIAEQSVSETHLIKERLAQEAEAKEKRRSITLERRLSRTISRSSLKIDFQQTQEQLAKEKERHEQRKSQRLSKLYTQEELIAAGILVPENNVQPVKTYGRIASFEKRTQEIFEEQKEVGDYTLLLREFLKEFADAADLKLFKKRHKFEKLNKGLGGLVGVDHLKPWESKGFHIFSFRVSDAIPERVVFAWNKKEQRAYQVTFVNYHAK